MRLYEPPDTMKPGVHLVLAKTWQEATIATADLFHHIGARLELYRTSGAVTLTLDRAKNIGHVHNLGAYEHHSEIDALYEYLRDEDADAKSRAPNAGITWIAETMNPYVVDRLPLESLEDARQRLLFVREAPSLHAMDDDEARLFWGAFEVGIQQISEILRTEDLW